MAADDVSPFINGHRYSHSSIEIRVRNRRFYGVKQIAYGSELPPGYIQGSDTEIIGRTQGSAKHTCEMEMYSREFRDLIAELSGINGPAEKRAGYGLVPFDVFVAYDEQLRFKEDGGPPEGVTVDRLFGCRISRINLDSSAGPDPIAVRMSLDVVTIGMGRADLTIDWRADNVTNVPEETLLR